MNQKVFDVIGLGDPNMDLIVELEKMPDSNTNIQMYEYCFQGGGNVATAMAASGMLGLKSAIVGVIGDDILAQNALADFAYNHVDTSHLVIAKGERSNFCLCVTERSNQGKEFISKPGTFSPLQPEDLDEAFIKSARVLHIGQFTPAVKQACQWMHESGGVVSIDAAYYRPDIFENYAHIDIFIASEHYYRGLCRDKYYDPENYEDAMHYVQKQGPQIVIFTFGSDGCRGVCADKYFAVPAFDVNVVDSTGAGDVFHGAYIYAYLRGWDPEESARFSSAVSAIKCTQLGGRAGIPDLANVMRFLEEGVIDDAQLNARVEKYRRGFTL
jgi:sulfofructose kinase